MRKTGKRIKEIKKIQLAGKIADNMMGKIAIPKYLDPGSPVVKIHINGIEIQNTLIDLGAAINIRSRKIVEKLKLPNLLFTSTLLQWQIDL